MSGREWLLDAGYRRLLRPLLFRAAGADPERIHEQTLAALIRLEQRPAALALLRGLCAGPRRGVTVAGIAFPALVGLAAGMDKNGVGLRTWAALGFGHVEIGTVTIRAQPGNVRPRLFRLPASGGLVNRMGFNNDGASALAARLERAGVRRGNGASGAPLGISIGKNRRTPVAEATPDYLACFAALVRYADYVAVNVSSPNTPGLRALQEAPALRALVESLTRAARAEDPDDPVPILVKVAPDLSKEALEAVVEVCEAAGARGTDRHQHHPDPGRGGTRGALAGRRGRRSVRRAADRTRPRGGGVPQRPDDASGDRRRGGPQCRRRSGPARRRRRAAAGLHRLGLPWAGAGPRPERLSCALFKRSQQERGVTDPYGVRLAAATARRGPLCVGIDPHPGLLRAWDLPVDVGGLERFARGTVAALGAEVAVFKPQSAFFEAYGSRGVAVLEATLVDIAAAGALSLCDAKRGDIGSTMDAYAAAYLSDGSPLAADAVTLSPYLGFGSLDGAVELARTTGPRGLRPRPDQQRRRAPVPARTDHGRRHGRSDGRRRGRPPQRRARTGAGRGGGRCHDQGDRHPLRASERFHSGAGRGGAGSHGRRSGAGVRSGAAPGLADDESGDPSRRSRPLCPATGRPVGLGRDEGSPAAGVGSPTSDPKPDRQAR